MLALPAGQRGREFVRMICQPDIRQQSVARFRNHHGVQHLDLDRVDADVALHSFSSQDDKKQDD